jgi:hypothetical protein
MDRPPPRPRSKLTTARIQYEKDLRNWETKRNNGVPLRPRNNSTTARIDWEQAQERYREEKAQRLESNKALTEIRKQLVEVEVERILVGDRGHWIQKHGEPAGDGREKYSTWSPKVN